MINTRTGNVSGNVLHMASGWEGFTGTINLRRKK